MHYAGVDIGGTKCAVSYARKGADGIKILERKEFSTKGKHYSEVLDIFAGKIGEILQKGPIEGIGISCGGPLDSKRGVIMSPPNLPGWNDVRVVGYFEDKFGIKCYLQNDANACAVAEWKYGAGRGCDNMVFLTFGTGFGAGLILDGRLYRGQNDNAGEVGHIRLTRGGPVGYNKAGSAEGYCSGGGIRQLGIMEVKKELKKGEKPRLLEEAGSIENIDAKLIAKLAYAGDPLCLNVYKKSGQMLGKVLSYLIDIINPQRIIIGGVFMRSKDLLLPHVQKVIKRECLSFSRQVCEILPAGLGENVGDYAAVSIAEGDYL